MWHFDSAYNGTYINIAKACHIPGDGWSDINSYEGNIWYRQGIPNSNGSITWSAGWQLAFDGGSTTTYPYKIGDFPSICVDQLGRPVIIYSWLHKIDLLNYACGVNVTMSSRTDGVWSTASGFPYQLITGTVGGNRYVPSRGVAVPSTSNANVALFYANDGDRVRVRIYSGSMGAEAYASTDNVVTSNLMSAIGLNDNYMVAFESSSAGNPLKVDYGKTSWTETTVVSSFDTASSTRAPVLTLVNSTVALMTWCDRNATADYVRLKPWTGTWASDYIVVTNDTNQINFATLNAFYAMYQGYVGMTYMDNTNYLMFAQIASYQIFSEIIEYISFEFQITNMNAGNWLFAEEKYYLMQLNITFPDTATQNELGSASINFTDAASNAIVISFEDSAAPTYSVANGIDYAAISVGANTISYSENISIITWHVMLRIAIIDKLNVDFFAIANIKLGNSTGWVLVANDYANIYSRGGLYEDFFAGDAGRLPGGDIFELYAFNESCAVTSQYWRYLQHVKLQFLMVYREQTNPFGPDPPVEIEYSIHVHDGTGWYAPLTIRIDWYDSWIKHPAIDPTHTDIWIKYNVSYIDGTGAVLKNEVVYSYFKIMEFVQYQKMRLDVPVFLDLWLNRINGSSTMGARLNSYYYPIHSTSNIWEHIWFGGTWGVDENKTKESMCIATMKRPDGSVIYAKQVELAELRCRVAFYGSLPDTIQCMSVKQYDIFDLTITTRNMEGIQTPTFEETKVPQYATGGLFGSIWSALAGVIAAIVSSLSPMLSAISSALIGLVDTLFQAITGQPGVFSGFINSLSASIASAISFMLMIAANIVTVATTIVSTLTWFIGTFFGSIWGIIQFIFITPAFNIISVFQTILGISYAWLAGTAYAGPYGTYDFSGLSNMHFMGFTGGICIFFIIFIAGTFLQILKCFSTMSLGPIVEPVRLIWRMILAMIQIMQFMWTIVHALINVILKIISTARELLPRIPFL
jgi:hypothetical protein